MERNELLLEIIERDYNDYTGLILEQYFRQKRTFDGGYATIVNR